jgi:hypothetical protein
MIQHTEVNKSNKSHPQNEGQKSYDQLNKYRKPLSKSKYSFKIKTMNRLDIEETNPNITAATFHPNG